MMCANRKQTAEQAAGGHSPDARGHSNVRSAYPQAAGRRRWLSGCLAVWDTGPLSSVSRGQGNESAERGAFLGIFFPLALARRASRIHGVAAAVALPCASVLAPCDERAMSGGIWDESDELYCEL